MAEEKRFAILIDADNIAPKYIKSILNEISNKGIITYKRIYGDWTSVTVSSWKKVLLNNSITPIQQYSYTYGKNSTDSAMIIDAMDILYGGEIEGFAICSSDSDFTRLAARLREAGKMVIGLGESKTPAPFCAACNEFKFLDRITDEEDEKEDKEKETVREPFRKIHPKDKENSITPLEDIASSLKNIILENGNENNGIDMGELGSRLQKRFPDFDTRNYGYSKLSIFLKSFEFLSMEHVGTSVSVTLNVADSDTSIERKIIDIVRGYGTNGVNLGTLSSEIRNIFPDFNPKEFGFSKFEQYIRSISAIEVKSTNPLNKKAYIKRK